MNANGYAPCAHTGLFLHYAGVGLAVGIGLGAALGIGGTAGIILTARAIRKHRDRT